MFDKKGRVWLAAGVRGMDNRRSARRVRIIPPPGVPIERSSRQAAVLDPKTMKYSFVDPFRTHHPHSATTPTTRSGQRHRAGGGLAHTKGRRDRRRRQGAGLGPFVLTSTQRQVDEFVEPERRERCCKRQAHHWRSGSYAVMPHPTDGSIGTPRRVRGAPGFLRYDRRRAVGIYNMPNRLRYPRRDIDKNGVAWGSASNGKPRELRSPKCKGPLTADRDRRSLPGGWTFYRYPARASTVRRPASMRAITPGWPAQHAGLGENIPIQPRTSNDGFVALKDGQMVSSRIPSPMGFYAKGSTAASTIRMPAGRARLWSTNGDRTPWLMEGGKGSRRVPCTSSCGRSLAK